ncbi:CABIN1 [Lepeophtheirus salmonis]|uniref:CABIN1 n=1 Tax=Lepeophtheirus salmonis TaxID=72036 RepID=A0A7R8D8A9_LEPSM|nr:CABIN1 [Lepeophtheirus salmonis]CAF3035167.1 CABIN1 [Lepeophtheirus salmonis]
MILRNFSAVNESSRNGDSLGKGDGSKEPEPQFHQELEEDKYVSLYSRALGLYGSGRYAECLQDFLVIFESEYFKLFGRESPRPSPVAVKLQKCVAKYLGFCYEKENNHRECIKYLKESLSIDDSDVTLYFKVALSAIKMHNLSIARSALEAGLRVSPEHWPSLELAIMVSFKTKDHFWLLTAYP